MAQESNIVLPVEILDYILSFLQGDNASLNACANANPLLFAIAQKYIYRYVTVHNEKNSERDRYTPAHLCKILQESPHIAAYVQHLRIIISPPGIMGWFLTRSLNDQDIATVLPLLPALSKITLTTPRNGMVNWTRLNDIVQSTFLHTLHLPSMADITINSIDSFPLAAFDSCSSLKRLAIEDIATVDLQSTFEYTSTKPKLEHLSIRRFSLAFSQILDWLLRNDSPDITQLRSVDFQTMNSEDVNRLPVLLQQCSNTLTDLVIDPGNAYHTMHNLIDGTITSSPDICHLSLSNLHRLDSLTIHARIWSSQEFWMSSTGEETIETRSLLSPLQWIADIIQTLPDNSHLRHLALRIHFKGDQSALGRVDWDTLEQAVASDRLKGMKSIELWVPHHDIRERKSGVISMNDCVLCGSPDDVEPQCPPDSAIPPCEPCRKMNDLSSRIDETKALLTLLLNERHVLKTEMNQFHDPVNKLPPELVSRICTLCMFAEEEPRPYNPFLNAFPYAIRPPLLFGAVCKRWRDIAWSTPRLWTRLNLYLDLKIVDWQTLMTEEWLARSGSLPLSIRLRSRGERNLSSFAGLFRSLMYRQSARWKNLKVDLPYSLVALLRGDLHGVSALQTILINDTSGFGTTERSEGSFQFGQTAPSLISVDVKGFYFRSIGIDWRHVTTVRLGEVFEDECLQLFQLASSMVDCGLSLVVEGSGEFGIPVATVVSHSVQRLDVCVCVDHSTLFRKTSFPSLQSFIIEDASIDDILSLTQSSNALTHLHMSKIDATEDEFIQLFYATPHLEILRGERRDFLAHLGGLSLFGRRDYSLKNLPRIFAPGPPSQKQRRRPWEMMEIGFYWPEDVGFMDQDLLKELLEIIDRGIDLKITNEETGVDLIERSQMHHGVLDTEDDEEGENGEDSDEDHDMKDDPSDDENP
ncbi:hypothetical protein NLJ89_g4790 [Agrocybe chaxingu]|uniref:F-box domain-containing protein n=1 Tax=Agrocybe chaxingu TaxID=84603 RepID=A0A9W8K3E8_9AGAR|nr:hypothetical protein NLJ89_g4790 [Agrocybe chaxingu]